MSQLTRTITVTTRELAELLNVDVSTVQKAVKRLNETSDLLPKYSQGQTPRFTEEQATLIKQEIQKHHNLANRQIDNVYTQVEENQIVMQAMTILQNRNNDLKRQLEEERKIRLQAEKVVNRIADGQGCFTMNQTAKALKLPYGHIKLYEKLRGMQILNHDNSPKQEHINNGHFKVIVKHINDSVGNKPVTITTSKGLVYLAKKFNTEIDTSVLSDA